MKWVMQKEVKMTASKKKLETIARYDRENCVRISLKFNKKYDAEVIEKLWQVDNKQGYIKALIIADIERRKNEC